MVWYSTDDARRDAQRPRATEAPSLATILRVAREAGAWEPDGLPSDWEQGDLVFSRSQLFGFARLLAAEIRNAENAAVAHDDGLDGDGGACSVCGGPIRYGSRHRDCAPAKPKA